MALGTVLLLTSSVEIGSSEREQGLLSKRPPTCLLNVLLADLEVAQTRRGRREGRSANQVIITILTLQ